MDETTDIKPGDEIYNGRYGCGVVKQLYKATLNTANFKTEIRALCLFTANRKPIALKLDDIQKI